MEIVKQIQNIGSMMEANRIGKDCINIINTLKLDKNIHETAHSRALQELLRLGKQYDYPLLKLFFATVGLTHLQNMKAQSFSCEKYNIDIFIKGKIDEKKYGIIIENKINYACDQDKQIKRYIEIAQNQYGCDANNIYVLYLTRHDNHHLPQEYSISPEERTTLEARNQFKLISYEKEILHFLSNILDTWNNDSIKSAVYQYRDYIRALVHIKQNEKELKKMDKAALYNSLGYSTGEQGNTEQLIHFLHQMKEIETVTYEAIHDEIIHDIKRSCDGQVVAEKNNEYKIVTNFKNSDVSLQLRFIFEGNYTGYSLYQQNNILVDHNDKPISQDLDKKIKFFFDKLLLKKTSWNSDTKYAFCNSDLQNATDSLIEYQKTLTHAIEWLNLCENLEKEYYHSFVNEANELAVVLTYQDGIGQNSLTLFFGKQEKRFWYGMRNAEESEILADKNKKPIDEKRNNTIKTELKSFAAERGCTFDAYSKQWFSFWCANHSTAFEEFIDFIKKTKSVLAN